MYGSSTLFFCSFHTIVYPLCFLDWDKHTPPPFFDIRLPTNSLLNSLVKNSVFISFMHFQTTFFHPSQFILYFFSIDTIYLFVNTSTTTFISFSKYSFHLFNTASELTITLPYSSFIILTCCITFPALSLCLPNLYNSFSPSFVSNIAYKTSYACRFAIATAIYYFHLLFYLTFSSPLSFLLCFPVLYHYITMSLYLVFVFQMSLPAQFQLFFLAFLLFSFTYQVIHPRLPKSWSPPV